MPGEHYSLRAFVRDCTRTFYPRPATMVVERFRLQEFADTGDDGVEYFFIPHDKLRVVMNRTRRGGTAKKLKVALPGEDEARFRACCLSCLTNREGLLLKWNTNL